MPVEDTTFCEGMAIDCNKQIDTVQAVTQALSHGTDPYTISSSVIHALGNKLGYSLPMLLVMDEKQQVLRLQLVGGDEQQLKEIQKKFGRDFNDCLCRLDENNMAIRSLQEGKAFLSSSMKDLFRTKQSDRRSEQLQKKLGIKQLLTYPIHINGISRGVLILFLKDRSFASSDFQIIETIANTLTILLHQAESLKQSKKQINLVKQQKEDLETLTELSLTVRLGEEGEKVFRNLLNQIPARFSHLQVIGGGVLLLDEEKKNLQLYAMTETALTKKLKTIISTETFFQPHEIQDSSLLLDVVRNKKSKSFSNLHFAFPNTLSEKVSKKIQSFLSAQSFLAFPLQKANQTIGLVLIAFKLTESEIDERIYNLMRTFVNYLSVAYENLALVEAAQDQNELLEKQKKALRMANERLQLVDKAKSEFISIASHQLRTPLTVMKGYVSLIQEGSVGKCDDVAKESLNKIAISTDRLVTIVNDLLDVSKIEQGILRLDRTSHHLQTLAESVVDAMLPAAKEKGLTIKLKVPKKKTARMVIDRKKIEEVMTALIDNAIKYTNKGVILVSVVQQKNKIIFSVKDHGIGFAKEMIPRLFKKFSRDEGVSLVYTEGIGLGLYVAKHVIESHGGEIWGESSGKGYGSTFAFSLPVAS